MVDALHLLLTYQCTRSCPHCFVWGKSGCAPAMTSNQVIKYVAEADSCGIGRISLEGGEPFILYPVLMKGVRAAQRMGLDVSVVTNGFWAVSTEEACQWLMPLVQLGSLDMMISTDDYHGGDVQAQRAANAAEAAKQLAIEVMVAETNAEQVMFRGRAAVELAPFQSSSSAPMTYDHCPHESLLSPGRVHLDPLGYLHLCQGVCAGRLEAPDRLAAVLNRDYGKHPIISRLADGGPASLVEHFSLPLKGKYVDSCHLCYMARQYLRGSGQFTQYLAPGWVYGEAEETACG